MCENKRSNERIRVRGKMRKIISRFDIALIIFIAFLLRLAWLFYAKPTPVSDFAVYKELASNLLAYHQYGYPEPTAYRLPGYPIFLALSMLVSPSDIWLSLVNVLMSTAQVYLIFCLAVQLSGNRGIGITASCIAAVYPIFVFFSPVLASEHLFSVLIYGGLVLLLSNISGKKQLAAGSLAGLLFGLATITRGEAIYYIPIIGLLGMLPVGKAVENKQTYWDTPRIYSIILLFISWGLVVLPWYIRNQLVIGPGSGLGTSGGIMFYYGHHDKSQDFDELISAENLGSSEVERSANAIKKGLDYIYHAPIGTQLRDTVIEAFRQYAPNGYPVFWSVALPRARDGTWPEKQLPGKQIFNTMTIIGYLIVGTLALFSLIFIKAYPPRLWITIVGFALMNLIGYAVIFAATSRYRYTIEGFLCILAAITVWRGYTQLAQRNSIIPTSTPE